MSTPSLQQWKCALGNVMKKTAYPLGGLAFVGALWVSRVVRTHVAAPLDAEVGAPIAFGASFIAYLLVVAAGGLLAHFAVWRVGVHLTQTQELPWKRDEIVTRPRRAPLTSSTPVP